MKTWFITGASRGFGALIMEAALASDAVVATARDPSSIADHPRLLRLPLDVTNEAQARDAAARAIDKFGRIDVLVNTRATVCSAPSRKRAPSRLNVCSQRTSSAS